MTAIRKAMPFLVLKGKLSPREAKKDREWLRAWFYCQTAVLKSQVHSVQSNLSTIIHLFWASGSSSEKWEQKCTVAMIE
jgi:hypothetical protein